jgi:hypothetical protein
MKGVGELVLRGLPRALPGRRHQELHAAVSVSNVETRVGEWAGRICRVGQEGIVGVGLLNLDHDLLARKPSGSVNDDRRARRVIALVGADGRIGEHLAHRERIAGAVQSSAHQHLPYCGHGEEIGREPIARGAHRSVGDEDAGNRIVEFGRGDRLTRAGAACDQHLAIVWQRQAEVAAARGDHLRGQSGKGLRGGIEILGGVEIASARGPAALDEHGAVEQDRRGRAGARLAEASDLGDRTLGGIENLGAAKRSGRIGAAGDQDAAVGEQRGGMILPRVLQDARRRECSRGRIEDLKAGELPRGAASAGDQDAAVG